MHKRKTVKDKRYSLSKSILLRGENLGDDAGTFVFSAVVAVTVSFFAACEKFCDDDDVVVDVGFLLNVATVDDKFCDDDDVAAVFLAVLAAAVYDDAFVLYTNFAAALV